VRVREPARMKVAVIEPVGGHGGMDYYDFGLCGGLSEANVDVTLYTCDETAVKTAVPYTLRFPYRRIYGDAPAWMRGARYVRGSVGALLRAKLGGTRVAHFHFFHVGPLELFNVALARALGLRVVVTAHDVRSFVERLSVPWMVERAYRLAHRVIAQSEVAERELGTKVPMHKMTVIPHGNYLHVIDETPAREEARERLGLSGEGGVLLFFGQIKEVKGLDVLLRAMPRLIRERPDTTLLIAGKVWKDDFEKYRRQIDALRISGNCVLDIRFIPDPEVAGYYAAADMVVLPYRRIYQSGVLLMAMSYGRPVMVSDIEGMTEVVSDGENGYVFPAGDDEALAERLIEVMSRPEEMRRVGARALSHMHKHHGWDAIGQSTAECYRAALKAG
jgi:D-inositol-3-phosphate glycosyltransferase